jgi:hypothetical protein
MRGRGRDGTFRDPRTPRTLPQNLFYGLTFCLLSVDPPFTTGQIIWSVGIDDFFPCTLGETLSDMPVRCGGHGPVGESRPGVAAAGLLPRRPSA